MFQSICLFRDNHILNKYKNKEERRFSALPYSHYVFIYCVHLRFSIRYLHFTFWYTKKVKNNGCFGLSTGHVVDCESGAFIEPDLGAGILTG